MDWLYSAHPWSFGEDVRGGNLIRIHWVSIFIIVDCTRSSIPRFPLVSAARSGLSTHLESTCQRPRLACPETTWPSHQMVVSPVPPLGNIFDVDPQNDIGATSFGIPISSLRFPFSYRDLCTEVCPLMITCILPRMPSIRVFIVVAS